DRGKTDLGDLGKLCGRRLLYRTRQDRAHRRRIGARRRRRRDVRRLAQHHARFEAFGGHGRTSTALGGYGHGPHRARIAAHALPTLSVHFPFGVMPGVIRTADALTPASGTPPHYGSS